MKKLIALFLVLTMMFSLSGCGLSAAQQIIGELTESESSGEPEGGEDVTEDPDPVPGEALTLRPVQLLSAPREDYESDEEGLDLTCRWEEVVLREAGVPALAALQQALTTLSAAEKQQAQQQADALRELAEEDRESGYAPGYSYQSDFAVRRADTNFVSLLFQRSVYSGGVHPGGWYDGITLDAKTGKTLQIRDIFEEPAVLAQAIMDDLAQQFADGGLYEEVNAESILQMMADGTLTWVLDPAGLTVIFSEYVIAPYAAGTTVVTIPYGWYPEQFDARCTQLPAAYAVELDPAIYIPVFFDVDEEDGYLDSVSAGVVMRDEWYAEKTTVNINGTQDVLSDVLSGWRTAYLLKLENGSTGVYLFSADGPVTNLYICMINTDGVYGREFYPYADRPACYTQEGLHIDILTDPANFRLSFFVEILSSLQGIVSYRAQEDGTPLATQEEYLLENDFVLTLLRPMTFALTDGSEKEFAVGTAFTFLATDGATWVDMLSDAGEQVRIYVDVSDWPERVNGIDVFEVFDGVMYAG